MKQSELAVPIKLPVMLPDAVTCTHSPGNVTPKVTSPAAYGESMTKHVTAKHGEFVWHGAKLGAHSHDSEHACAGGESQGEPRTTGERVGATEGYFVGATDGYLVGATDGYAVGAAEGYLVGNFVGALVGAIDG
jgi:hypothetical protein